jgi:surface polysaccharide O-acyltransferase-like enzyme
LSKRKLVLAGLGMILSWLLVAGLTYQLSNVSNSFVETYYKYNSWPVILLSSFSFLFLKFFVEAYVESFSQKFVSIITSLSKASFGIYFVHLLVFKSNLKLVYFPGFIFIPIISLVLYLGSFFIAENFGSIAGAEERT